MTDPIERVAHFLEKIIGDEAGRCAAIAVPVYREWLRQQGIPIERLLSGEMVVIPYDPECDCSRAVRNLKAFNEAQLDYALNADIVTPDLDQFEIVEDDVCMCGMLEKDHTGYEGHSFVGMRSNYGQPDKP